jgi:N-formylglutamate deformylase
MEVCVLHAPKREAVPIIASLPHSGLYVPPEIDRLFTQQHRQWLRNTDWHLPQLYSFLPELGVTMLEATHSRYVVDLNRDPSGELYGSFTRAVVASATSDGAPIYAEAPDSSELAARVVAYHAPYHKVLRGVLADTVERFGRALLLDLHSFMGPIHNDICIGDRRGSSCSADVSDAFHDALNDSGFDVVRNAPFAGGYIVRAYANPPAVEALQIELRYTVYLDCAKIDEPGRPELDPSRIAAAQARLQPAMTRAITSLKTNGNPDFGIDKSRKRTFSSRRRSHSPHKTN